jgi:catechol 2,3-dioxygenase-like lactoylglutathione lyase family enzyme
MKIDNTTVSVRYLVTDVPASVEFYTRHLGFERGAVVSPAFADVKLGNLRLLLSGPASSGARPLPDGRRPEPGGWNRIHLVVDDIKAEVANLRAAGLDTFRSEIISGPGGSQVVFDDPSGNPIELFQPAGQ